MKTTPKSVIILILGLMVVMLAERSAADVVQTNVNGGIAQAVSQVGPNSRTWTNGTGRQMVEMTTGMNYWDGQQWNPSNPSFEITQDGSAVVANRVQARVSLAANLNAQGSVSVVTPDGIALNSTPIGIGLYDAASGNFTLLASITNCTGSLVSSNIVVYSNAFDSVCANVIYSLERGSFHQDVVITGRLNPADYGFPTNTTRIQVITEFYGVPQPDVLTRPLRVEKNQAVRNSMASPDLMDQMLGFGEFVFGAGRAYTAATTSRYGGAVVGKAFVTTGGRQLLIESFEYPSLQRELNALPECQDQTGKQGAMHKAKNVKSAYAALPLPPRIALSTAKIKRSPQSPVKMADGKPAGSVVIDYVSTIGGTMTSPVVYRGDTTYFVSANVYCNSSATIERGCIFKYPTCDTNAQTGTSLQLNGSLTLTTTNYGTAIFTAADDDTVGSPVTTNIWSGYTGSPAGKYYGWPALVIYPFDSLTVNNLRFSYCGQALSFYLFSTSLDIFNVQFINCVQGVDISVGSSVPISLNNCLMSNVQCPIVEDGGGGNTNSIYNCTFDNTSALIDDYSTNTFVNCIFANVATDTSTFSGTNNGFFNSPSSQFGVSQTVTLSSPFQTSGAGNYYLTGSSFFFNAGITNISPAALADIQLKTTRPPVWLTNTITTDTILGPQTQRETGNAPDLGYHYDAVDFICFCPVTNAMLTLTNGVALAYFNNAGIWLQNGSQLVSQGTPNQRNYFAYYPLVQEQPAVLWSGHTAAYSVQNAWAINPYHDDTSRNPTIYLRFTTLSGINGAANIISITDGSSAPGSLTLRDCEVYGAGADWYESTSTSTPVELFQDNLFHRPSIDISSSGQLVTHNNLILTTNTAHVWFVNSGSSTTWTNQDNAFDGGDVYMDGVIGHNAYLNGAALHSGMTLQASDIQTNLTWEATLLGNYYQATNSPLRNQGSTSATNLGLYFYTTTTNQIPETNSIVDIGYHFIALGTNGLPLSTSGDGIGDYLKDSNGNGVFDIGDLGNWLTNSTSGDGISDYLKYIEGRNLRVSGFLNDTNGTLGLQVYTPLK